MSAVAQEPRSMLPAKEDPEALVLRGSPRRPVRFRRGLIVGIAGAVAASVIGIAWLGLEPPHVHDAAQVLEGDGPAHKDADDALAPLPKTYGDVPRLGPPLPGDLGRPIVEQQRALDAGEVPPVPDRAGDEEQGGDPMAEAELQRAQAQERAARSSSVLVPLQSANNGSQPPARTGAEAAAAGQQQGGDGVPPSQSHGDSVAAHGAPSRWTLSAGTVLPATLVTGLNSDVPGAVLAQVSENVRDSATGRTILVPQGARLIGSYGSALGRGQRRALLVWKRIVFPDGSSVDLHDLPATDVSGYAGVADRVDFHTWGVIKGIALSTLLGIGSELSLGGGGPVARAIRQSSQQNGASAGDQITSRTLDVQPTITVRPGWPVRAIVNEDLVLKPWRG